MRAVDKRDFQQWPLTVGLYAAWICNWLMFAGHAQLV